MPQVAPVEAAAGRSSPGDGFALEEFTLPDRITVIGHAGSTAGYAVMMFRVPAHDTTLVTAVNTTDLFANAVELFMPATEVVTGAR